MRFSFAKVTRAIMAFPFTLVLVAPGVVLASGCVDHSRASTAGTGGSFVLPPLEGPIIAADVSEAKQAQDSGVVFTDVDGEPGHYMDILKRHGFNMMISRVHVNPPGTRGVYQTNAYVKQVLEEAKSRGLMTMLSFMYADSWSDAGQITLPVGWPTDQAGKLDKIYSYTQETMREIGVANIDHVKLGNENDRGLLGTADDGEIAALMARAYEAVKALNPAIYCSIHSTQWAGWFQVKRAAGAKFDYCAVSHYPMWQGNVTTALAGQLQSFAQIGCKVFIVETGGYYRTAVGQLTWPYAFTEDGQLQFMSDVKATVAASPGCVGMAYWGTCWSQASAWAPEIATAWDETASRALFDDSAQATAAIDGWR